MKRITTVLLTGTALGSLLLAGCGGDSSSSDSADAGGTTAVKVSYVPITVAAVLVVGEEQGFFDAEGLDLTTQQIDAPPAGIAAAAGGQVDFAYAPTIPIINAAANGVKIKVAAPADGYADGTLAEIEAEPSKAATHDDTALIVQDPAITSPKDLAGKSISVPARGAQLEVTIANAIKEDGGDPSTVEWIALDFPSALSSLKDGRIAGSGVVQPFISQGEAQGARNIASPGVNFFGDGAVGVWVTSDSFASENPETIAKFQRAIVKSNAYANEHSDEIFAAAATLLKIDESTLRKGAVPYFPATVTANDVTKVVDKLDSLGFLKAKVDGASLVLTQQ